jgi:hypothetical protein
MSRFLRTPLSGLTSALQKSTHGLCVTDVGDEEVHRQHRGHGADTIGCSPEPI